MRRDIMIHLGLLVLLMLLSIPVMAQDEPPRPLVVGETVKDAIVAPFAQFADHRWQAIVEDSSGLPPVWTPYYWYQLTAGGKPLIFSEVTTVKVLEGGAEDPYWVTGTLLLPEEASNRDKRMPFGGQVLVDSLVPGGIFVFDSSRTTRNRVLELLKRVFPDSLMRPTSPSRMKYLPKGSAPVSGLKVQRLSPVAPGQAALMLIEAERCLIVADPTDCGHTQVIDLWLLDHGSRYQLLGQRGPIHADTDFKSGTGRRARAWLDVEGRRFLLVDCSEYTSVWTVVFEVLPTGVRQVHPGVPEC